MLHDINVKRNDYQKKRVPLVKLDISKMKKVVQGLNLKTTKGNSRVCKKSSMQLEIRTNSSFDMAGSKSKGSLLQKLITSMNIALTKEDKPSTTDIENEVMLEPAINLVREVIYSINKQTLHFSSTDFSRQRAPNRHQSPDSHVGLKTVLVDNVGSFINNTDSIQCTSFLFNMGKNIDKRVEYLLPEYTSIKEIDNQNYNELKDHMIRIFCNKPKERDHVINWKKSILSHMNPLGNAIATLSNHFIDNKTEVNHNLIQSYSTAIGTFIYK